MSEEYSPKRMPCRVHSTFEIAEPLNELPPDREALEQSPETIKRRLTAVNNLLANATCEEGTSMDSIATYIPPKAVRKQMEEEQARLRAAAIPDALAKGAKKAAKIAALEAQLEALRRGSADDDDTVGLEKLTITRPTSVVANAAPLEKSVEDRKVSSVSQNANSLSTRSSLSSNSAIFVAPPAIGALVAAPPAMGALMAAPPAIGALVAAALQPAAQKLSPTTDQGETGQFSEVDQKKTARKS